MNNTALRSTGPITLRYEAVDGFRQTRKFYSLAGARKYALDRVGADAELTRFSAVAPDGIGVLYAEGVALADLLASAPAPVVPAPECAYEVDEDGRDNYTGEDDLTEAAIENANDEWASRQTAIDAAYGA